MQVKQRLKPIFILNTLLLTPLAMAHEGHGMAGSSHWHAADGWGWIVALAVAAILWGARKP
ncbi:MAG: hypothetical protein RLZZ612_1239 [Pseudomonadota bacterium]|jgi:hypothetical protein